MRVLIIKTSSMGDVIHTLPALTEAGKYYPDISFDWVVEPAFAEIPRFHPLVNNIILSPLRAWRKNMIDFIKTRAHKDFYRQLRQEQYDYIIDAQGLIKSGILTYFSRGIRCGYDKSSAWEPFACLAYDKKFSVNPHLHAIMRIRQLFAQVLNYAAPDISDLSCSDYGICLLDQINQKNQIKIPEWSNMSSKKYAVFLHSTSRHDKCWPENYWIKLIELLKNQDKNLIILLPWGNHSEYQRAERLAYQHPSHVKVLPKLDLTKLAGVLLSSYRTIAVDTGLGHLSAALNKPTISLYGPTDPNLVGTVGNNQIHIKKKNLLDIMPEEVCEHV